jgi:hypothetical protein
MYQNFTPNEVRLAKRIVELRKPRMSDQEKRALQDTVNLLVQLLVAHGRSEENAQAIVTELLQPKIVRPVNEIIIGH